VKLNHAGEIKKKCFTHKKRTLQMIVILKSVKHQDSEWAVFFNTG